MPRSIWSLTELKARSNKLKSGLHSDGGNLYLKVSASGTKSWVFVAARGGKRIERGLGKYPVVTLVEARRKAGELNVILAGGGSLPKKPQAPASSLSGAAAALAPNFENAAKLYIKRHSDSWKNAKHRDQWSNTLRDYCGSLAPKPVVEITVDDVEAVLTPIWLEKHETAKRVRGRIEAVLAYAANPLGWVSETTPNPARWRHNLANRLPLTKNTKAAEVKHHPALPYLQAPEFMERLRHENGLSARALELVILTAARSGEVLKATWDEIDLESGLWIIPAGRMKAGKAHEVPLPHQAVDLLAGLSHLRTCEYVFPSAKGTPLSDMAITMLLRRMEADGISTHGFRSTFRDWAGDMTDYPKELAETALAHKVGDSTEAAYRRSAALNKRRAMMQDWADYLLSSASSPRR